MMFRIRRMHLAMTAAMLCCITLAAHAQTARPPGQVSPSPAQSARRLELEERFRERTGEVIRRRLALTDAQMSRLQTTNRQFEQQQAELLRRERETRVALRAQLLAGDSADQSKVGRLLDESLQLQRQRIDLVQNEQRELAKFLTPVQRAKYLGFQNELRRRAQELRNRQMQRRAGRGFRQQPMVPPRG